jgi:hypothetical protein
MLADRHIWKNILDNCILTLGHMCTMQGVAQCHKKHCKRMSEALRAQGGVR